MLHFSIIKSSKGKRERRITHHPSSNDTHEKARRKVVLVSATAVRSRSRRISKNGTRREEGSRVSVIPFPFLKEFTFFFSPPLDSSSTPFSRYIMFSRNVGSNEGVPEAAQLLTPFLLSSSSLLLERIFWSPAISSHGWESRRALSNWSVPFLARGFTNLSLSLSLSV